MEKKKLTISNSGIVIKPTPNYDSCAVCRKFELSDDVADPSLDGSFMRTTVSLCRACRFLLADALQAYDVLEDRT